MPPTMGPVLPGTPQLVPPLGGDVEQMAAMLMLPQALPPKGHLSEEQAQMDGFAQLMQFQMVMQSMGLEPHDSGRKTVELPDGSKAEFRSYGLDSRRHIYTVTHKKSDGTSVTREVRFNKSDNSLNRVRLRQSNSDGTWVRQEFYFSDGKLRDSNTSRGASGVEDRNNDEPEQRNNRGNGRKRGGLLGRIAGGFRRFFGRG